MTQTQSYLSMFKTNEANSQPPPAKSLPGRLIKETNHRSNNRQTSINQPQNQKP